MKNDLNKYIIKEDSTLLMAMKAINENYKEIVFVVDKNEILIGVITDGDIRRALLQGMDLSAPVYKIMNKNFISVDIKDERVFVLDLMKSRVIRQVPIIDPEKRLIGIHFLEDLIGASIKPNIAVIMAGGKGTRLNPLTMNCPKPMIQVAGRPILERIILHLIGFGIRKIYLSVNYLSHIIEDYCGNGTKYGCLIEYIKEEIPLGTAGALSLLPEKPIDPIIVINGDIVTQVDMHDMLTFHTVHKFSATLGVKPYNVEIPFGVIRSENDRLLEIQEKPLLNYLINAGIYIINPELLSLIPSNEEYFMNIFFQMLLEKKYLVGTYIINEDWADVGRHDVLNAARGL